MLIWTNIWFILTLLSPQDVKMICPITHPANKYSLAPKWRQNGAKKTYMAPHMTKRHIWRQKDIIWHTDRWQFSTKHHYLVINSIFLPKRTNFQTHRRQNLTRVRASLASDNTQIVIEWCKYSRIVINSDE